MERRTLLQLLIPRGAVFGVGLAAALACSLWVLPGSPVTLWRADAALGGGAPTRAVALYDDVGAWGWTRDLRASALRRSSAVLSVDLGRPAEARARLDALISMETDPAVRAALQERIGELYLDERNLPEAARSFIAAHAQAVRHPRAAERLVLAARAFSEGGEVEIAARMWERLVDEYPRYRGTARLAQGRAALAEGDPQAALRLFDAARAAARTPDQQAAARLGFATALERLGSLDEAIAEIDQTDLPGEVRESRLEQIRARLEERQR